MPCKALRMALKAVSGGIGRAVEELVLVDGLKDLEDALHILHAQPSGHCKHGLGVA